MPNSWLEDDTDTSAFTSDNQFNQLYPPSTRALADKYWTPVSVARQAAAFLAVEPSSSVLDIGSGAGKFCLVAAYFQPSAHFFGVEQRPILIAHAEAARITLGLSNITFLHGNFTQLDFNRFDHFYFYNSFFENLSGVQKIDQELEYSTELFHYYSRVLYGLLDQKPSGTRLVTYHSMEDEVPGSFQVVGTACSDLLKFWVKG